MSDYQPNTSRQHHPPLFERMPELGDEAVWDLLEMLYGLIDAYESHYAQTLQRLRLERFQELHEGEHQLNLPTPDTLQDRF
ncbi:MAG: hypothetical protein AB8B97_05605 [Granulosicoccus sp.]